MSTKHLGIAAVVVATMCGVASCAQRTETSVAADPSEVRVKVGHEVTIPGEPKPFQVPLQDSLARIRQKPPGAPDFGDFVHVTHLPQPVERHSPVFPAEARAKSLSGKVIVQTLVLTDGTVGETWIIKSVPGLDEAAAHAVQLWKFTPALDRDKTVAVWVAVPVEFKPPSL